MAKFQSASANHWYNTLLTEENHGKQAFVALGLVYRGRLSYKCLRIWLFNYMFMRGKLGIYICKKKVKGLYETTVFMENHFPLHIIYKFLSN